MPGRGEQRVEPAPHLGQRHPLGGLLGHQAADHGGQRPGRGAGDLPLHDADHRLQRVAVRVVGRMSLGGGEQGRAQPPQVGGVGHRPARGDLGGDERGRTQHHAGVRHRRLGDVAGDAEVGELDPAVPGDEHVARLHVPVGDALGVRGLQRGGHRLPEGGGLRDGEPSRRVEQARQAAGRQQLHDDVGVAVLLDDVVQDHHVRVGQHRDGPGLAQGAFAEFLDLVRRHARRHPDLLHRHLAVQELVVGRPDGAHRAGTEHGPQSVAARHRRSVGSGSAHPPHCGEPVRDAVPDRPAAARAPRPVIATSLTSPEIGNGT